MVRLSEPKPVNYVLTYYTGDTFFKFAYAPLSLPFNLPTHRLLLVFTFDSVSQKNNSPKLWRNTTLNITCNTESKASPLTKQLRMGIPSR